MVAERRDEGSRGAGKEGAHSAPGGGDCQGAQNLETSLMGGPELLPEDCPQVPAAQQPGQTLTAGPRGRAAAELDPGQGDGSGPRPHQRTPFPQRSIRGRG